MKIALFADIHGKFLLPFKLVDIYQKETGNQIDYILQCGDMGAYPSIKNLDKATIRHAKNDRDELGFHDDFVKEKKEIKSFLDALNVNMICVRGNHEDHDFLDELENNHSESIFPIDIYKRVFVCKSGIEQKLEVNNEILNFVGIGRIGDRKGRTDGQFIQEYEKKNIQKLRKSKTIFDVLITHDKSSGSQRGFGMDQIRNLLDHTIFKYQFFGHTGESFYQETDLNGITQSVKIKELEFSESGILPPACMLILDKTNDELNIEIVSQQITNQLTKFNWKF